MAKLSTHMLNTESGMLMRSSCMLSMVMDTNANKAMPAGGCTDAELAAFTSGALQDDRVAAIIPMAGTVRQSFFGETGYEAVTEPVLFMSGTEDNPDSSQNQWETATQATMHCHHRVKAKMSQHKQPSMARAMNIATLYHGMPFVVCPGDAAQY